jgi:hypothetical protein
MQRGLKGYEQRKGAKQMTVSTKREIAQQVAETWQREIDRIQKDLDDITSIWPKDRQSEDLELLLASRKTEQNIWQTALDNLGRSQG